MTGNELIVLAAIVAMQALTIWLWLTARADAHAYKRGHDFMVDAYTQLHRDSIRRDPRTGRYIKKG